eukprot:CAMPEP_0196581640 /NCGR_PEP_ID=MMETSP1081-20130531/34739_1 /TAXON_ID=36882 /ORGANISM="Pyramimonas amylifera, Strain CCMP720" /LENGTH=280 /DNA_ID=CAMNT_0041901943 /DNA_START=88 /DNA_END=927 /DNA_ORIENTATION=+
MNWGVDLSGECRFSVGIPGAPGQPAWITSDLEIGHDGLRLRNSVSNTLLHEYKMSQIDSWWHEDGAFVFIVVTPKGDKEVVLKCRQATLVMEAMQACVDNILQQKQMEIERKEAGMNSSGHRLPNHFGDGHSTGEIKRGWLAKRRNKFPKSWQKRFFILAVEDGKPVLKYYEQPPQNGEDSLGEIDLGGFIQVYDVLVDETTIEFQAWQTNKSRMRKFILLAENGAQRKSWTAALENVAASTRNKTMKSTSRNSLADSLHSLTFNAETTLEQDADDAEDE